MLEVVVFVCGAAVMIFELAGSRILAPWLGASIFVWASLIGIILGSLSLGYWLGGKISDKKPHIANLTLVIFIAAILIGLSTVVKDKFLMFLVFKINNLKINSIIASLALFALPSILLGMVSPFAVKLKMKNLKSSGKTVGNLYAISTVGSIFGTFLAGFVLIPFIGITKILFILSITLIVISLFIFPKKLLFLKFCFIILIFILIFSGKKKNYIKTETQYNSVIIVDRNDKKTGKKIKVMAVNRQGSSAMFLNSNKLVNEYTKYYKLAKHFLENFKKSLMIGGAAYSFPKFYLREYPDCYIDVVEIDPKLTDLAKKYFRLKENPRLKIYHEDGRTFINRTKEKYDVVMIDAFKSIYSIPYQLTTKETVEKIYQMLSHKGVVILNMVSAINGKKGEFLRAEYATYKAVFSTSLYLSSFLS